MGNYFSSSVAKFTKSRKRKRDEASDDPDTSEELDIKRFRLDDNTKCTINELREPDIVLRGFDRQWPCHRSVLCQSDFFRVLLNGDFLESKSKLGEVTLHDCDDILITEKSFEKILDLLYGREIDLENDEVFNLAVTAQYFQMLKVVEFCEQKITSMVCSSNCIDIYHFADRYFLDKTKRFAFNWMLVRLFPVKCWDQLKFLTLDLAIELISNARLVTPNEMYLYHVLKIFIQIQVNSTCEEENEKFYAPIRSHLMPFLLRNEGKRFSAAFDALRLKNIVVRRENVETIIRDNIIPRSMIEASVFSNWMSLISIESPDNFGPTSDIVSKEVFERNAMRFSKIIQKPDYHSWKFLGFSFAFDLAFFFDGRTLIVKRVHQINEHKIINSHLLRKIMIRWSIADQASADVQLQQDEILNLTMTTNEEVCLKQLQREPTYPCRISIEVLFHVPYKSVDSAKMIDRVSVSNTSTLKSNSIPSKAFQAYKRFFS